jgi:hypothetical protein
MKVNKIQMPANTTSYFGAPICGHASDVTFAGLRTFGATTTVVRERQAAPKGDMGLVAGFVPGTSAWSPPFS